MKKSFKFALIAFLLFSHLDLKAQEIIDDEVRRLATVVYGIEEINALAIEFKPFAAQIDPASEPNLRKQAEILKKFPAGTIVEIWRSYVGLL